MSGTRKAQARDCSSFAQMIHITWILGAFFFTGIAWGYRAYKRRESAALFLGILGSRNPIVTEEVSAP
jgi:hypothetical protein